jgi:hypothetical protein
LLASDIQLRYVGADVESDGGVFPLYPVVGDSSNTVKSFSWQQPISNVNWTYALGWFDINTGTPELRGVFFAVRSFTATQITLVSPLPVVPEDGDAFYLISGLRFSSGRGIPTVKLNDGVLGFRSIALSQITGVSILDGDASVDLWMKYDDGVEELQLSADGEDWGASGSVPFDVSGGTPLETRVGRIQAPTGEWLTLRVKMADLPSASVTEGILITGLWGSVLPELFMDEEDAIVHHFAALHNLSVGDTANVRIENAEAISNAVLATPYTEGDSTLVLQSGSGFPARDFWLYLNESEPDLRYVIQRADKTCHLADTSKWQEVPFSNGMQEPLVGAAISCGSLTGMLRAVYVTSGTWGVDAAGLMVVSGSDGLFGGSEQMIQEGAPIADVNGGGYYGIRGLARKSAWAQGASVQTYPAFDVMVMTPDSSREFDTVNGCRSPINVLSLFTAWAPETGKYQATTVAGFGPGDVVALVLRRFLLSELAGNIAAEHLLNLSWD